MFDGGREKDSLTREQRLHELEELVEILKGSKLCTHECLGASLKRGSTPRNPEAGPEELGDVVYRNVYGRRRTNLLCNG
jgi:hypothetical protein